MCQTSDFEKNNYLCGIAFFSLISPVVLYFFRSLDDNRLTSWYWVFSEQNSLVFFLYLLLAIVAAFFLSNLSVERFPVFFLFSFSFAAAACFWEAPEVIVDSARYFTQAKYLATHGLGRFLQEWGKGLFAWTDLPTMPLLYGYVFKLFGETRRNIQIVNTLFFSGSVLLTYALGRFLWDKETGFYGGLLLLAFAYIYSQVPMMLVDVPTMFFLLLANYTYCRAIKEGGACWVLFAALSVVLTFFVKYSTWVLLSNLAVISLVYCKEAPQAVIRRSVAVFLIALALVGIAMMYGYGVIREQIDFLLLYQKPGLKRWGESYLSTFLFQIHPFVSIGALFSLAWAVKKKDRFYLVISYLVILLLVVMQVQRIRYTLPLFPMIALMAAYGMQFIKHKQIKRFLAFCMVNSALVVALFGFLPFLKTMSTSNLQDAGRFLDSIAVKEVTLATVPVQGEVVNPVMAVPTLDLFTKKDILFDYETAPLIDFEGVKESPLRFTWEYIVPSFYSAKNEQRGNSDALVVVASNAQEPLPKKIQDKIKHYKQVRHFTGSSSVFLHQSFVSIYYSPVTML